MESRRRKRCRILVFWWGELVGLGLGADVVVQIACSPDPAGDRFMLLSSSGIRGRFDAVLGFLIYFSHYEREMNIFCGLVTVQNYLTDTKTGVLQCAVQIRWADWKMGSWA